MTFVAPRPVSDRSESTYATFSENIGRGRFGSIVSGSEFCRYPSWCQPHDGASFSGVGGVTSRWLWCV